jgi:glycosyltransferase involved in cell wall biosynthesis
MGRAQQLGVAHRIVNLGKVPVTDTPDLYARSHLSFLPSLLEVFSAVYPESLCTGVPLVTTDLRFSRDVCKDAAVYFEPTNAKSAAAKIVSILEDEAEWRAISNRGRELFAQLPSATRKWELQRAMMNDVASRT